MVPASGCGIPSAASVGVRDQRPVGALRDPFQGGCHVARCRAVDADGDHPVEVGEHRCRVAEIVTCGCRDTGSADRRIRAGAERHPRVGKLVANVGECDGERPRLVDVGDRLDRDRVGRRVDERREAWCVERDELLDREAVPAAVLRPVVQERTVGADRRSHERSAGGCRTCCGDAGAQFVGIDCLVARRCHDLGARGDERFVRNPQGLRVFREQSGGPTRIVQVVTLFLQRRRQPAVDEHHVVGHAFAELHGELSIRVEPGGRSRIQRRSPPPSPSGRSRRLPRCQIAPLRSSIRGSAGSPWPVR